MKAHYRSLFGVACAGMVTLFGSAARAQVAPGNGDGFDTHLFRPALDSKGFFTVNGTDILGKNDVSIGLVIDYGRTLLRVPDNGSGSPQLINHSFQGTATFNYGLANILALGVSIPVNLMSGDERGAFGTTVPNTAPPVNGWSSNQLDSQTIGYLSLHAKLRITRVEKGPGLALSVQAGVPVTDAPKNAGADPTAWVWPQVLFEQRIGSSGRFKVGLNAGLRVHGTSSTALPLRDGNFKDGNLFTYGAAASYRILDPVDIVAETYGTYLLQSDADAKIKPSNEVVGGLKIFVERNSFLMLGAGPRYTDGFEAANIRGFIGFVFEPSIGDRDGDGIKDDVDQCPDDPEDIDGFKDEDGCPDPDNDGDGILDKDDRCPNEPEDRDGIEDDDGCPEGNMGDRDGDGIPDNVDKCPDQPEDKDGFQDQDGCPDPDNDMDGIPD